jgi:hypothetical protein
MNSTECRFAKRRTAVISPTRKRAFKIFAAFVVAYLFVILPGFWWPEYLDSPLGTLAFVPFMTANFFNMIGVPNVLTSDGACGWWLCDPTAFGWVLSYSLWLVLIWLASVGLSKLTSK